LFFDKPKPAPKEESSQAETIIRPESVENG